MDAVSFVAVAATVMIFATELFKKLFPKHEVRYFTIGFCLVAGLGYALAKTYVPIEILKQFTIIGGLTYTTATAIYKLQK